MLESEMCVCDKAVLRLNRIKLYFNCLEFRICPKCGEDLKHRDWSGSGGAYGDHLYCSKCEKVFYLKI